jgi:hypothetical protein
MRIRWEAVIKQSKRTDALPIDMARHCLQRADATPSWR